MNGDEGNIEFKVAILGPRRVGKTSLITALLSESQKLLAGTPVSIAPVGTLFDQSQNRSRKLGAKLSYERAVPGFEALTLTAGFDVQQQVGDDWLAGR